MAKESKNPIMRDFRYTYDPEDAFQCAMSAWFSVCEELYLRNGSLLIPEKWQYNPGAFVKSREMAEAMPEDERAALYEICKDSASTDLLYFGWVMFRFISIYKLTD